MRFLFLNQYFPPDPAPTGLLLREIADRLAARGHEVEFIASTQNYRATKTGPRALRELQALLQILRDALFARKPDVIVSATSPPLLLFAASLAAWWHRAKGAHWLFDMYPELALALGEIRDGWFARAIRALMRWSYRRSDRLVAVDEDMLNVLQKYNVEGEAIAPWVFAPLAKWPAQDAQPFNKVWLYSGNLGRAHEWKTLLDAQALLEQEGAGWKLVFQGGGPSWPRARAFADEIGLRNCEWKPYVAVEELRESLCAADVLIATQRPETQGLLWPSKLALVTTLPRRILWIGPTDGAIARGLRAWPQAGIFAPGQPEKIAAWVQNTARVEMHVADPVAVREAALEKWCRLLEGLGS